MKLHQSGIVSLMNGLPVFQTFLQRQPTKSNFLLIFMQV